MNTLFANYLIVDWSAAAAPKRGADSVWCGWLQCHKDGRWVYESENPDTRHGAYELIHGWLAGAVKQSQATFAGFDFPLGYPHGFAAALRAGRGPAWRSAWDAIAAAVRDQADNTSNRFEVAAEFNRKIGGRAGGPFWGCPAAASIKDLSPRKPKEMRHGLAELRLCESWNPGPQSAWKLYTAGSVGSQALLGIPYVRRLCQDPVLSKHVKVWPFETGLTVPFGVAPGQPLVMIAEVWPSLVHGQALADEVKDQTQVRVLAEHLAKLDKLGRLARLFAGPRELTGEQRQVAEQEEGWILGVL